jgi:hypothetical protein
MCGMVATGHGKVDEMVLSMLSILTVVIVLTIIYFLDDKGMQNRRIKAIEDDNATHVSIKGSFDELKKAWEKIKFTETIDCAACGCMVKKEKAIRGPEYIEEEMCSLGTSRHWQKQGSKPQDLVWPTGNKRFANDLFCRRCAPSSELSDAAMQKMNKLYAAKTKKGKP